MNTKDAILILYTASAMNSSGTLAIISSDLRHRHKSIHDHQMQHIYIHMDVWHLGIMRAVVFVCMFCPPKKSLRKSPDTVLCFYLGKRMSRLAWTIRQRSDLCDAHHEFGWFSRLASNDLRIRCHSRIRSACISKKDEFVCEWSIPKVHVWAYVCEYRFFRIVPEDGLPQMKDCVPI